MAKKSAKSAPPTNPLAGQRVAFVGKFGYGTYWTGRYKEWAAIRGATVVEPTADMDIVVYGAGRGGKPPGEVAKIEKRLPAVETLDEQRFCAAALPEMSELAEMIRTGPARDHHFWNGLSQIASTAGTKLDLSGADFRKADLKLAQFGGISLAGTDFRDADLTGAALGYFGRSGLVTGAKFDGATLTDASLYDLNDCSFRKARMNGLRWIHGSLTRCDFREAVLTRFPVGRAKLADCDFRGADLTGAFLRETAASGCDFGGATMAHLQGQDAKFTGCKFGKADLRRAQLVGASLKNADLRGADLSNAVLVDADLTGAQVAGANFDGAVLVGAKVTGVDFSKARNYTPPVARKPGPALKAFEAATKKTRGFSVTTAEVEIGPGETATLRLHAFARSLQSESEHLQAGETTRDSFDGKSVAAMLLRLAQRWPNVTLRQDTVAVQTRKSTAIPKLLEGAVAAWAEAFGVTPLTADELTEKQRERDAGAIETRDEWVARLRKGKGVVAWNETNYDERRAMDLRGVDLSGTDLAGFVPATRDLAGAKFANANLTNAQFGGAALTQVDFTRADLTAASLAGSDLQGGTLAGANLTDADLRSAKLQGVDLSTATLSGVKLEKAQYDERTQFPPGFEVPLQMTWKGSGPRTGVVVKTTAAGSMDFATFFQGLGGKVDSGRISNATTMLKAERFQLYADVTDAHLVGIVKSQSSSERVYSCRLGSDGSFCCGTQNLRPCGGLRGALCKHLMVLVIGLAKAGKLDPAVADNWVNASKGHQPAWDDAAKDALSETFLKFKGVEAGEIDWRPTETLPEDFYAL